MRHFGSLRYESSLVYRDHRAGRWRSSAASSALRAVNVLLLTDNSGSLTTAESTLKTLIESAGYTVNTLWDGDSQANYTAAFANNDVVYIPSSVSATDIGNKLRDCPIGVVNEIAAYMDELGLCSSTGTTTTRHPITISTNSHYITSPFATGAFHLGSSSYTVSRAAAPQLRRTVLATVGGMNSILAVDTGGTLANTISSNSIARADAFRCPSKWASSIHAH